MKFFKLQIIAFVLFYAIIHGTEERKSFYREFKEALSTSLNQVGSPDNECIQRMQQNLWLSMCSCGNEENNVVGDEENLLNHIPALEIQNNNAGLIALETVCKISLPDNQVNGDDDNNARCLFCQYLYEKEKLAYVAHSQSEINHHSFCLDCLCETPHLYGTDKCFTCRQNVREVKMCGLLQGAFDELGMGQGPLLNQAIRVPILDENAVNEPLALNARPHIRIKYDGALLATVISSWSMFALSCYITSAKKELGDAHSNGEFQYTFSFDLEQLSRDTYGYLALLSTYFLYDTRTAATILIDKRGLSYLLLPIVTLALTAHGHLNTASLFTIIPLFVYIFDLYTANLRKTFFVSPRFGKFAARLPQLKLTGMNQELMQKTSILCHIKEQVWYNLQYWNLMGSLVAPFVNWKMTKDTYNDFGEMDDTTVKIGAGVNAIIAFAIMFSSHKDAYDKNKLIITFNQLGQFFLSTFMVRHSSPALLEMFLFINIIFTSGIFAKLIYRLYKKCCQ
jgi:uncharacterized Tic20 family protein